MNDIKLHQHYLHFSELPSSMRVLYTAALLVLGLGYLFALLYLFHSYAGRAGGNPMQLSYKDVVVAYAGKGQGSRLEAALRGPMSSMLPVDEATTLITWVETGTDKNAYEKTVKPMLEKRCLTCHDGSNPHLPNLNGYDNLKKVTEVDKGTDIFTLVRVSHIHSFGLTFVFFLVGTIFGHAYMRPVWLKCAIIGAPYLFLVFDILSWYLVKLYHPFAYLTIGSGAGMGTCFLIMWVISMYQMWLSKAPQPVVQRSDDKLNVG